MFDKAPFYALLRKGLLGPTIEPGELAGCEAILAAMEGTPLSHCAYALATAYHETARTMQPVREAYWLSEAWRKAHFRYWPWYGRGYVQLTWRANYERADKELGLDGTLLANADRAMEPGIAAQIMRRGMTEGWFTAHTLAKHLPGRLATPAQYEGARRIINKLDCAHAIAVYAEQFEAALVAGDWA